MADHLESIDPQICARYLEYLIGERNEESAHFHDRLAELYLGMTLTAKRRGDESKHKRVYERSTILNLLRSGRLGSQEAIYAKLLQFIDSTHHYRIDRLYGLMSSEGQLLRFFLINRGDVVRLLDLFEARAILLGRLGRHDQALELYVYRMQHHHKAEEYIVFSHYVFKL